jgi:putative intracellular protease/amidase
MAKVLFVVTGAGHWTLADGTKHPTGFWAEEVVRPYCTFVDAGYEIVVATPGGVLPPVDPRSLTPEWAGGQEGAAAMTAELASMTALKQPVGIEDVDLADLGDYTVVFYPGGHGPMEDLSTDAASGRLLTAVMDAGQTLAVVCHGPAAFLAACRADGDWPFAGYRLTGFSNAEETQLGLAQKAKWTLQDRLVALGANYTEGEPWAPHVVVDRNLHTGQNPASAGPLAVEVLGSLT